jgi:hypothetical protein
LEERAGCYFCQNFGRFVEKTEARRNLPQPVGAVFSSALVTVLASSIGLAWLASARLLSVMSF